MSNKFDGVRTEHLIARTELNQTTYRVPVVDKLALGEMTTRIKSRTLDPTITDSDVLRALLRYAAGTDIEDVGDRARHVEMVTDRVLETLLTTATERAEILEEIEQRRQALSDGPAEVDAPGATAKRGQRKP